MARSKVKSRSHYDIALPTNVPTKYQLPTHYGCHVRIAATETLFQNYNKNEIVFG